MRLTDSWPWTPDDPDTWELDDNVEANDHLSDYSPSHFEGDAVQLEVDEEGDAHMEAAGEPEAPIAPPPFRLKRKTRAGQDRPWSR